MSSSPWAKISQPEEINFKNISEEIAKDIEKKREENSSKEIEEFVIIDNNLEDEEFAKILQEKYDGEYAQAIRETEETISSTDEKIEFNSKTSNKSETEADSLNECEIEDFGDLNHFEYLLNEYFAFTYSRTFTRKCNNYKTRLNPKKDKPEKVQTELEIDMKILNSLLFNENANEVGKYIHQTKNYITPEFNLDSDAVFQLRKLFKIQLLKSINTFKSFKNESIIFHAYSNASYSENPLPKEIVIKVFKIYTPDSDKYEDRISKKIAKKNASLAAKQEMQILIKLNKAGIPCPKIIFVKHRVLVTTFIGKNWAIANSLKWAKMSHDDYVVAYKQVVEIVKSLLYKANLIHSYLRMENIYWHNDECHLINKSQLIEANHDHFHVIFLQNCTSITDFFKEKCIPGVVSAEELFKDIVGIEYTNRVVLSIKTLHEDSLPTADVEE